jgi:RNA polymerase sigma-70 factor (ECF subfamily)
MRGLERYASSLTSQPADAQDLVQETYRKALIAHATFVPGSDVSAWLRCILRNAHRDRIRHARHEITLADPYDGWPAPVPDDPPLWNRVSDEDVTRALARLPPIYRSVYVLRAGEGRSYHEIARTLCIPEGTVATRLSRARRALRSFLLAELPAAR